MRILLAPDKFKQTLSQEQAAAAMTEGVHRVHPDAEARSFPMADGGEGTLWVLFPDQGKHVDLTVTGPLGAPIAATCGRTAERGGYVEMALCSGLALIPEGQSHPMRASSRGTGEAILQLAEKCTEVRVGVGGSASSDGGTGAARAAGYRFLDRLGREIPEGGGHLEDLASIDAPTSHMPNVTALCDVMVPLLGPKGAARGFAPQKGATKEEVLSLEAGLFNLAAVIQRDMGLDVTCLQGGGAGGGMGAGLAAFFGAKLISGAAEVADVTDLNDAIAAADLVVTGEGRLDRGTLGNKVVAEVARRAVRFGVPVIAVCGQIDRNVDLGELALSGAYAVEDLEVARGPRADAASLLTEAVAAALKGLPTD